MLPSLCTGALLSTCCLMMCQSRRERPFELEDKSTTVIHSPARAHAIHKLPQGDEGDKRQVVPENLNLEERLSLQRRRGRARGGGEGRAANDGARRRSRGADA